MAQFEIVWEAPEFEYREKDTSWYWLTIIIAAIIVAFSVWTQNFLFGFFVVVAEVLLIVWGNRIPRMILFHMNEHGISVGEQKFHTYKEFESWSADMNDGWADVAFYFRSRIRTPLKVIADEPTLEEIRKHLKTILKEIQHEETLLESIEKLLRF